MFDVGVPFPKMSVAVRTRDGCVVEIRFDLPLAIEGTRAVGQACGVGGFAHSSRGWLIEAKRRLLAHELSP
jgi:hypothetical protein